MACVTRKPCFRICSTCAGQGSMNVTPRRLVPYGRRHSRPPHPLRQWLSSGSHFPPGIPVETNASATRYGLMPASWITFAHFGMSALIRALNSSGGTAEGSYPIAAIFSLRSGEATARAISRYKRSTISRGVPAGAQTHCGASCTWPGTPASSIVGTSGRIAIRFVLVTATQKTVLDLCRGRRQGREGDHGVAPDQRLHHRGAAVERHHRDVELERELEQLG